MSGTIKTIKAKDDNNIEQNIFPKTVLEAVVKPETNETLDNILDGLENTKVNKSGDTSTGDLTVDGITTLNNDATVKGQLIAESGTYVSDTCDTGQGYEGYIVFARMETTSASITNEDIEFDIQCTNNGGKLLLRFNNPSVVTDTRIETFTADFGLPPIYYTLTVGTDKVTIDLIARKKAYQIFRILNIRTTYIAQNGIIITYPNTFENTLRDGAVWAGYRDTYMARAVASEKVYAYAGTDKQVELRDFYERAVVRTSKRETVDMNGNIYLCNNNNIFVISCTILNQSGSTGYACVPFVHGDAWFAHVINIVDSTSTAHLPPPDGTTFDIAWAYTLL